MLKTTAQLSPDLQAFIQSLDLPLNQAQESFTQVVGVVDEMVGKILEELRRWGYEGEMAAEGDRNDLTLCDP